MQIALLLAPPIALSFIILGDNAKQWASWLSFAQHGCVAMLVNEHSLHDVEDLRTGKMCQLPLVTQRHDVHFLNQDEVISSLGIDGVVSAKCWMGSCGGIAPDNSCSHKANQLFKSIVSNSDILDEKGARCLLERCGVRLVTTADGICCHCFLIHTLAMQNFMLLLSLFDVALAGCSSNRHKRHGLTSQSNNLVCCEISSPAASFFLHTR